MNKHSIIFLGLDTHKEFNEVAYCEDQRDISAAHYSRGLITYPQNTWR
ncbi:hypothetical protein Q4574_08850 [Aliiglaciecola sp. 3_MG-2023]|nr:hypothetical protein [Aliiglaciecola sp. 3_MG-2023]MDO6693392.1 hypothetical protein [Aliiglaciecola sp. 3_MG-2023]